MSWTTGETPEPTGGSGSERHAPGRTARMDDPMAELMASVLTLVILPAGCTRDALPT
ncbi:hypothetical protein ACGFJ5_04700 [Micromonospora echinaurantiaca]|uniref:hypothetical protein n=1 Tax=Micromonospora echinaurantiaca TaxID=47857 RepID=UPI003722FAEF